MNYCIIGGGHFGEVAVQAFLAHDPKANIEIVDTDREVCAKWRQQGIHAIHISGPQYLWGLLGTGKIESGSLPDWIVPSVPIHLAYEWLKTHMADHYRFDPMAVPDQVAAQLPNTMAGAGKALYFSLADFRCPAKCPAPADHCAHTGTPRPLWACQLAAAVRFQDFRSIAVYSEQLHPGVGGYRPTALLEAAQQVRKAALHPILLSTACRCHGVMHGFRLRRID